MNSLTQHSISIRVDSPEPPIETYRQAERTIAEGLCKCEPYLEEVLHRMISVQIEKGLSAEEAGRNAVNMLETIAGVVIQLEIKEEQ